MRKPRLCWVVAGDRGGGVIWVADSCCREAVEDGYEVSMLALEPYSEGFSKRATYRTASLGESMPYNNAPEKFMRWMDCNRPDLVVLNSVGPMELCVPHLLPEIRCIQVLHDRHPLYWKSAISNEASLDAIVTVSASLADIVKGELCRPEKLRVVLNGTQLPSTPEGKRQDDIVFLGGETAGKGAYDVLTLWPILLKKGFSGLLHWFGAIGPSFQERLSRVPGRDRILLHGYAPRKHVTDQLAQSSMLLMLSHSEAFGLALVDAMNMGCVPVTWDIAQTASKEIVAEPFRYQAKLGDFEELARQVFRVLDARGVISQPMMTDVRERFNERRMWGDYRAVIASLIDQPVASRPSVGRPPPPYRPPTRLRHLFPSSIWQWLRPVIARSPRLESVLRARFVRR